MFESSGWQWLVLAAAVIAALIARSYFARNRLYKAIPPEERTQWGTWSCPSCGAGNYPEERSPNGRWVRGVCSACKKPWSRKRPGSSVI